MKFSILGFCFCRVFFIIGEFPIISFTSIAFVIGVVFSNSFGKLVTGVTVIVFFERWGEEDVEIAHGVK
ncbi:hypothetical protein QYS49_34460 [Marivirga salinae]|uniref:Uncharacterized protein n=1 Tax=Marivirga salinarum TaxID=3059078 RepID=A0AA51NEG5_9BACT|nr:hypothetical protein [Marivirga sp. BDSF4-3]WMN12731.1 hypothetical protein QYS49_34460 [Marivirga sp. BDSF4-3]